MGTGLLVVLVLGLLIFLPAVRAPLFLDDYLQGAMVEGTYPEQRNPFDLYDFVDDTSRPALLERGLLPWWSHPKLTLRFFRPLSSALLYLDHRIFNHRSLPMHVHSLLWWGAAVLAARALFRRVFSSRVGLLATLIFALAPCHALPLAWVANRETLISLTFGSLALAAHARYNDQGRARDGALSAVLFALALLGGGEYALSFGGYVLALELTRPRAPAPAVASPWRRLGERVLGVAPFALPAAVYLITRGALGYGTAGSGFYSDPLRDTSAFFANAPWRAVALLANGWLTVDSEAWGSGYPQWMLAATVGAVAIGLVVPVRRVLGSLPALEQRTASWMLLGSTLALIPTLAVVPSKRLLGVSMIGVSVVVALLLERAWFPPAGEAGPPRGRPAALSALAALGLGFAHLVHGPGTAWLTSRQHRDDGNDFVAKIAWLRAKVGDPTRSRIGIVRGMAGEFFAPFALDPRGVTPARWCVLTQGGHVLALRRDARTLDLVAMKDRALYPAGERNLYRDERSPLREGAEIAMPGVKVTILETGENGPRAARFVFEQDPSSLVWITDDFDAMREATLPGVGLGAPFDP